MFDCSWILQLIPTAILDFHRSIWKTNFSFYDALYRTPLNVQKVQAYVLKCTKSTFKHTIYIKCKNDTQQLNYKNFFVL